MINSEERKKIIVDSAERSFNVRDEYKGLTVEEIRQNQPLNGFSVCLLNLTGSLNIGTSVRAAVAFGADIIYIAGYHKFDKRSTTGSYNYVDIASLPYMNEDETDLNYHMIIQAIENEGWTPVLLETGGSPLNSFVWPYKPCIIMGTEGTGIPQDIVNVADYVVTIPMPGVIRSLNVSSAASIAMYDFYSKTTFC